MKRGPPDLLLRNGDSIGDGVAVLGLCPHTGLPQQVHCPLDRIGEEAEILEHDDPSALARLRFTPQLLNEAFGLNDAQAALSYLTAETKRCVIKSKAAQAGNIELNLELRLKSDNTDFINELSAMDGVTSAALVSYNGDYMG